MRKILLALALSAFSLPTLAQQVSTPAITALACAYNSGTQTGVSGQFMYVQCDSTGRLITSGGSGTIPGGSNTQVQYNNNGAFGGIIGATTDGTTLTLVAPVLGTPASGVATNLTGTAAGLTAGNVTTNANLTGPITSSGNVTSITAQTGTGTTFVVQTSPSITTPTLTGTTSIGGTANISSPSAAVFIHGTSANGTPVVQTIGCENAAGTNIAAASACINWGPLSTGTGAAGTYNISTGFAGLTGSGTFTVTSASPAVFTQTAHGYVPGQVLQASNSGGALPAGLVAATNYFVLAAGLTANNYEVSLTPGGAAVNTTGTGTGTQTMTAQTGVQNAASTVATFGPSGLTGSQATSALSLAQVWNTSGTPTALLINVTSIASNTNSRLADFQIGGVTKLYISKAGNVDAASTFELAGQNSGLWSSSVFTVNTATTMGWAATNGTAFNAPDTALSRDSAGVIDVGTGAQGSAAGSMKMTSLNLVGVGQLNVAAMTQTAVAQSGTVCYNSGTGAVNYDATLGCLTSTMTEKDNWQDLTPQQALAVVLKMQAGSFTYKKGHGLPEGEQIGLSAEQIAPLDDRLVAHRPNGDLAGVRYQQASALYPMAIQQLKADNDNLRAELRDLQRRVIR